MDGHVLIVEDEQRLRDIIRDYFTAHGADCDLARDGAEALELLRENDYDAILHAQPGRLCRVPGGAGAQRGAHFVPHRPGG